MKKFIRYTVFIFLFFVGAFSFINCQGIESGSTAGGSLDIFKSNNNGYSYGGKIEGQYVRLIPNFNCSGTESPASLIQVEGSSYVLRDFVSEGCISDSMVASKELFEFSALQNKVFGYKNFIFERLESPFSEVPDRLVETWCTTFQVPNQKTVELISYYNRSSGSSETDLILSGSALSTYQSTIKRVSSYRVQTSIGIDLRATDEFILNVDREKLDGLGRYIAELKIKVSDQEFQAQAFCRLGGTLDSQIWPLRPFVENGFNRAEVAPSGKWALFSLQSKTNSELQLHSVDLLARSPKTHLLELSIQSFYFGIDSNSNTAYFQNRLGLQSFDWQNQLMKTVFAKPSSEAILSSKYIIDEKHQSAYFSVYSPTPSPNMQLKKISLSTGAVVGLGPVQQKGLSDINLHSESQKLTYMCCNDSYYGRFKSNLYVLNLMTGTNQLISLPDEINGDYFFDEFVKSTEDLLSVEKDQRYFFIKASSIDFLKPSKYFLLDLQNEILVEAPKDISIDSKIINLGEAALISRYVGNNRNSIYIYNSELKNFESLKEFDKKNSTYERDHFFHFDKVIYSAGYSSSGQIQFFRYSIDSGRSEPFCGDWSFDDFVFARENKKDVIHAVVRQAFNLSLVEINMKSLHCKTLNKLPLGFKEISIAETNLKSGVSDQRWLSEFSVNESSTHASLKFRTFSYDQKSTDQLFLVPLNGKSSYQVNFPNVNAGHIVKFGFIKDTSKLYFWGGQKSQPVNFLYVFDF